MSTRTNLLKRFDELIEFGKSLLSLDPNSVEFLSRRQRWQTSCLHILEKIFGANSVYFKKFNKTGRYASESQVILGLELIKGAKEEIDKGLLYKIEHFISTDFFDSVAEQAEYLLKNEFKDVAAVLGRIVIENTLKDIAKRENIAVEEKKSFGLEPAPLERRCVYKECLEKHSSTN